MLFDTKAYCYHKIMAPPPMTSFMDNSEIKITDQNTVKVIKQPYSKVVTIS